MIKGILEALLDALHGEDERIGGQKFSLLTAPLQKDAVGSLDVETTYGFGEFTDGAGNARVLINGEVIDCEDRTETSFTILTRAVLETNAKGHPEGSIVWDYSKNASALDHVRRGTQVNFAVGRDLDVVGRNLGLHRCPGLAQENWRNVIRDIAYLSKNIITSFHTALEAWFGSSTFFEVQQLPYDDPGGPYRVRIYVHSDAGGDIRGKFILNGGEERLTTGLTEVETLWPVLGTSPDGVLSVYVANDATRVGLVSGATELYGGAGHAGNTVQLTSSPGPVGTAVIVNYTAFHAHHLAGVPESVAPDHLPFNPNGALPLDASGIRDEGDFYAYLSDSFGGLQCFLDTVRSAGIQIEFVSLGPIP